MNFNFNLLKAPPSSSCTAVLGSSLQHVGIQNPHYSIFPQEDFLPTQHRSCAPIAGLDARDVTGVMELMLTLIAFPR